MWENRYSNTGVSANNFHHSKTNGKIDILHTILEIFPTEIQVSVVIKLYTRLFSSIFIGLLSKGLEMGGSSFKSKIIE